MSEDTEFFRELDVIMKEQYDKFLKLTRDSSLRIYSVELGIELDKDLKTKYVFRERRKKNLI